MHDVIVIFVRKWTLHDELKYSTWLFTFPFMLMPSVEGIKPPFSLHLWVNGRAL